MTQLGTQDTETLMSNLLQAIGFTQMQVATTCVEGHDLTPPQVLLDAVDAVRDSLASARRDTERLDWLEHRLEVDGDHLWLDVRTMGTTRNDSDGFPIECEVTSVRTSSGGTALGQSDKGLRAAIDRAAILRFQAEVKARDIAAGAPKDPTAITQPQCTAVLPGTTARCRRNDGHRGRHDPFAHRDAAAASSVEGTTKEKQSALRVSDEDYARAVERNAQRMRELTDKEDKRHPSQRDDR